MPGVFKRASDKARGKAGKWTCWWIDELKVVRQCAGLGDKAASLEIARKKEAECRLVREGLQDPRDMKARSAVGVHVDRHADAYAEGLLDKGDSRQHARHTKGAIKRVLADAGIDRTSKLAQEPIQAALKRLAAKRSARTANHARAAIRAWIVWLHATSRIKELPRWLSTLGAFNEKIDRKLVRRTLSLDETARLLEAARAGDPVVARAPFKSKHHWIWIGGPEREILYRIAIATGFRAKEMSRLTPEDFDLRDNPTIRVRAAYTKNQKEDVQPIRQELADVLRPWLSGKQLGQPVLVFPVKTAKMLRVDLAAAGIDHTNPDGTVDFHALRHAYITNLSQSGADPKTVQVLARHSTITLTIDRYTKTDDERKRKAIEGVPHD